MKKFLVPVTLWLLLFVMVIAFACSKKLQPKQSANGNIKLNAIFR